MAATLVNLMQYTLRSFYWLSAGLLLLSTACKKDTQIPEPALEGSWNLTSSTLTTYSPPATQPTSQSKATYPVDNSVNTYYITFTSTTVQAFHPSTGQATSALQPYTRSGSTLTYPAQLPGSTIHVETITQLTATDLTVFSTQPATAPASDYTTYESHYTRR